MHRASVLLTPSPDGIDKAADALRAGALVGLPTETVYGLAADARDDAAIAAIFEAKGRPRFNPLIVHLADMEQVSRYAVLTPLGRDLAQAFWPGALTLVLPVLADGPLSPLVTAGHDSVALRVPAHEAARDLLRAFDGPVAAPSANPSGKVSPTSAAHVVEGLGEKVAVILDAGPCEVGVESTIIDARGAVPVLLRAGGLPVEAIEAATGTTCVLPGDPARPIAPGQMSSHYAPRGTMRLNVTTPEPGEVMVGFGDVAGDLTLSASGDLTEAASTLFACLHQLNDMQAERIAVAPIPETGLGRAINDRLRRAAAPRP